MTRLALLLLVLPLSACVSARQIAHVRSEQLADAEASCTARNTGAPGPQFGHCVNQYLVSEDGYALYRNPDGTLRAVYRRFLWPSPDAAAAFAIPPGPPTPPPPVH